jgi:hypothetical protein
MDLKQNEIFDVEIKGWPWKRYYIHKVILHAVSME